MRPADRDGDAEPERPGSCRRADAAGEHRPHLEGIGGRTRGISNPELSALEGRSKDELYEIAKRLRIEGRCRMTREQLIDAIRATR